MEFLSSKIADVQQSPLFYPLLTVSFVLLIHHVVYNVYFHPLAHIPGPIIARISPLWLWYHSYIGDEATVIDNLHEIYGPILLVSPYEVDISDPAAINPIYIAKGGFPKAPCYANFDIDGHKTIFSTTDPEYRSPRAKAVVGLFSTKAIKENEDKLYGCVDRMVSRLESEKKKGKVDILNLCRSLAVDAVSTHLFAQNYNGVSESGGTLSASAFVDTFVAVGRFFYLPNLLFLWLEWGTEKVLGDVNTATSFEVVEKFVEGLVDRAVPSKNGNYPGRLLEVGLSKDEVKVQCKDLIFAGTDSTGMNMATMCRQLVLNPEKYFLPTLLFLYRVNEFRYKRLYTELQTNNSLPESSIQEIQSLTYLSAVIRETLRISMANPTRLPHIVPSSGFNLQNTHIPAGTVVGCSGYSLHFNPKVFPEPHAFKPERWLENVTSEMNTSFFAWGAGNRACIARNLATTELYMAAERLILSRVLEGAKSEGEVEIFEWFNSCVKGEGIELVW
ncbi:Cytochrome P450 [Glarea lozoyensis ATCC 20868]|uniref:Cytochrome P450 n=1 Tax=Glarea lozoyensis (strain ATCC 20868 / MF5171) TaxID=1116229 RepID=S3CZ22_GLAL2|nr:Cytochrome P450 [Glarea lozoyensis ATCC 20868]EPE25091.1 Cytochrome P450 [Glarea lozoyensis ATCC 20868]